MKNYLKNKSFIVGLSFFCFILLIMIAGIIHLPYDPISTDSHSKLLGFSLSHPLGTDNLGRDVLSRIMVGIRISVGIGLFVMLCGLITGIVLGSISGWFGGFFDLIIMKLISTQMSFPGILLALILIAVFEPDLKITVFALYLMSIPRFTRICRSGYIKYKNSLFVLSAKARGAGNLRIMYLHILPNLTGELIVTSTISFSMAILSESGLSYLGLGVRPPYPSFGRMLNDAQHYIFTNPEGVLFPLFFLTILIFGLNLMGEGISEVNNKNT